MSEEVDPEQWSVITASLLQALGKIEPIVQAARSIARDSQASSELTPLQAFLIGGIIGASR